VNFKRKVFGIPVWLITLAMIASFFAAGYAAVQIYTLSIPSSVTVVNASAGLQLVASDGTTVVTSLPWGSVALGATQSWSGYLENVGTVGLGALSISSPDLGSVGTLAWNMPANEALAPGASCPVTISLTVAESASLGTYPFTIQITGSPANTTVVITASDPIDFYGRYWAVTFDRPMPPQQGMNGYVGADVNEMHNSGDTMTVLWTLLAGPNYLIFAITQTGGSSYGTYSGTITINGQAYAFSGVYGGHPVQINFTI
jgi:hypothetical protein